MSVLQDFVNSLPATGPSDLERFMQAFPLVDDVIISGSVESTVHDLSDAIASGCLKTGLTGSEIDALIAWLSSLEAIQNHRDADTDFLAITDRPDPPEGTKYAWWSHICRRMLVRMNVVTGSPSPELIKQMKDALRIFRETKSDCNSKQINQGGNK